jgi:hypothetical protein
VTAAGLLSRLGELGVVACADGGLLRLRPASAVPADLLAELRARKAEVLAVLAADDVVAVVPATLSPATAEQAADEAADRAAIAAEPLLHTGRRAAEPQPDMVEELAQAMAAAMAASPVYAGTTPDAALSYCRLQARRRLTLINDPLAQGLLLSAERHSVRELPTCRE